jgi:subtilisin family serine protease
MDGNCSNQIISEEYADFIADYELSADDILTNMEICYIRINDTFSSVYVPLQQVPADVLNVYGYKVFVRLFGLLDTASLESSGVTRLRSIPGLGLRGQGVLIGFVDTGIDYMHKAFQYADGTSKIVSIWDQSIQSDNSPEGFFYGTEYTREQINNALKSTEPRTIVPSMDKIGHGTFLAGIAAGNLDNENNFSGAAPDSEIVVVKLKPAKQNLRELYVIPQDAICYQENDIMLGVKYLLETAEKYNRPIAICIGLGSSQGSHDPSGALSTYLIGPSLENGYITRSGTSIAAAHATGVAALLLEWGIIRGNIPNMDGTDVKNLLVRGADTDPNRIYPNREWGYGILDIFGALESLRGTI